MQGDGNLAEYGSGGAMQASNTAGHPGAALVDQQDGNQVIYVGGTALWASKSSGSPLIFGQWPGTAGSAAAAV
ncbi:MAG TPA: hypothetical protein VMU94_00645 [Streptosporangiaceae bacterium]|nr:hypothetical protein [Streptosporangiaceae bacterium]